MNNKQELFDKFMKEFLKLNTVQKGSEIIDAHKTILAYLLDYAEKNGIDYSFIKSREINDIMTNSEAIDDYFEALMVYTHNIEELIGTILLNL